jgi:hypothetical protein
MRHVRLIAAFSPDMGLLVRAQALKVSPALASPRFVVVGVGRYRGRTAQAQLRLASYRTYCAAPVKQPLQLRRELLHEMDDGGETDLNVAALHCASPKFQHAQNHAIRAR